MKTIDEMTRADFENVPLRKRWDQEVRCASLVILPTEDVHDSGFLCMDFVAIDREEEPICRVAGGSDVIHIKGIGGYGKDWIKKYDTVPTKIPPVGWNIDCLPKSGLLRLFVHDHDIICGPALSSFEIWAVKREEK